MSNLLIVIVALIHDADDCLEESVYVLISYLKCLTNRNPTVITLNWAELALFTSQGSAKN